MNNIINEFKSYLPTEEENEVLIDVKDVNIEDLKETEEERKQKAYLENLSDEDFYKLLSAWDLGKSLLVSNSELERDIEQFGSKEKLFEKNVEILKENTFTKENAIDWFMGIRGFWIRKCLDEFQNKY
ncbi:TPA: hypothetical protein O9783_002753 [Staphylococcus aureus]|nr:hypothetical protein [Staphylococcus aureus]